MPDSHYPSIDIEFIEEHIIASGKLVEGGVIKIGSTMAMHGVRCKPHKK